MIPLSIAGALATPVLMLLEALQTHFQHPEQVFTLDDVFDNSLIYVMLLMNVMVYIAISAYLFSREYLENTLKLILPVPVSRTKLIFGKFLTLFLWIIALTIVTWIGIFALSGIYHLIFGMNGFYIGVALNWLIKFLLGGILMFLTISPYAFLAESTKGFITPMIVSAVMVMGSVALCNQNLGALFPWTAIYLLIGDGIGSTGYPLWLVAKIILFVSVIGFIITFNYFNKEDLK